MVWCVRSGVVWSDELGLGSCGALPMAGVLPVPRADRGSLRSSPRKPLRGQSRPLLGSQYVSSRPSASACPAPRPASRSYVTSDDPQTLRWTELDACESDKPLLTL